MSAWSKPGTMNGLDVVTSLWSSNRQELYMYLGTVAGLHTISNESIYSVAPGQQISDEIISAYCSIILKRSDYQANTHILSEIIRGNFETQQRKQRKVPYFSKEMDRIIKNKMAMIGILNETSHWTVLMADITKLELTYVNSLGEKEQDMCNILKNWSAYAQAVGVQGAWKIGNVGHQKQIDSNSCGVFALKFIEALLGKKPLDTVMIKDVEDRQAIATAIVENTVPFPTKCHKCNRGRSGSWVKCKKCERPFHFGCAEGKRNFIHVVCAWCDLRLAVDSHQTSPPQDESSKTDPSSPQVMDESLKTDPTPTVSKRKHLPTTEEELQSMLKKAREEGRTEAESKRESIISIKSSITGNTYDITKAEIERRLSTPEFFSKTKLASYLRQKGNILSEQMIEKMEECNIRFQENKNSKMNSSLSKLLEGEMKDICTSLSSILKLYFPTEVIATVSGEKISHLFKPAHTVVSEISKRFQELEQNNTSELTKASHSAFPSLFITILDILLETLAQRMDLDD